jgi:hypothetical protein
VRGDRSRERDVDNARLDDRETILGIDGQDSREAVEPNEDDAVCKGAT